MNCQCELLAGSRKNTEVGKNALSGFGTSKSAIFVN